MLHNPHSATAIAPSDADNGTPLSNVHVVYKTQLDLGYTDLAANVLARSQDGQGNHLARQTS